VPETLRCYRHPDRETGVSCSECGRGICPECMVFAPVGIRCPDHASGPASGRKPSVARARRRLAFRGDEAIVTRALVIINVLVWFVNLLQGASLTDNAGTWFNKGALVGCFPTNEVCAIGVGAGDWWRPFTAMFLHASLIHIGLNMVFLYWIGTPVERTVGHLRFLLIYLVSGLCGSAAVLVLDPNAVTVGASGAIFGILGAALVYERQRTFVLGGSALSIIVLNLILSFTVSGISIGGHVGGLIGGALCALAFTRLGKVHAAYGRPGLVGFAGVAAVALAAVLVSYYAVQSY
jgi:membrane associated rhomboid family serine protease